MQGQRWCRAVLSPEMQTQGSAPVKVQARDDLLQLARQQLVDQQTIWINVVCIRFTLPCLALPCVKLPLNELTRTGADSCLKGRH